MIKMWFNEVLIVHIENLDTRPPSRGGTMEVFGRNGYRGVKYNDYANINISSTGGWTTEVTYRFQDNMHVTGGDGTPISCAQIGFGTQAQLSTGVLAYQEPD
jgi:hypothetical protein